MERNGKHLREQKKKWILIGLAAVVVAAAGCGSWYYAGHSNTEPVYVYPFQYIGMTEYWGDSQESYGPVTTDKIQTVFLSDTQTVTEVLVQPGDSVKKGDVLMTFDTTLDSLALERKRLDVEKLKLQRQAAQEKLDQIRNMVPLTESETTVPDSDPQNTGVALKDLKPKPNVLVAGITHGAWTEIPNGDSMFHKGDSLVVVTTGRGVLKQLNDIFIN